MSALSFFLRTAVDGRAYLRRRTQRLDEPGRYQPDLWLIRHRHQLVLISDSDAPGIRFVADDERIEAQPDGTYRLCLHVIDEPTVNDTILTVDRRERCERFYFGRRTFPALNAIVQG